MWSCLVFNELCVRDSEAESFQFADVDLLPPPALYADSLWVRGTSQHVIWCLQDHYWNQQYILIYNVFFFSLHSDLDCILDQGHPHFFRKQCLKTSCLALAFSLQRSSNQTWFSNRLRMDTRQGQLSGFNDVRVWHFFISTVKLQNWSYFWRNWEWL